MPKPSQPDLFAEEPFPHQPPKRKKAPTEAPDSPPQAPKRQRKAKTTPTAPATPQGTTEKPAKFAETPRPWEDSVPKNFVDYTPEDWRHVGIGRDPERGGFFLRGRVCSGGWLPGDLRALGLDPQLQTTRLNLTAAVERGQLIETAFLNNENPQARKARKGDDLAEKMSPKGALLA